MSWTDEQEEELKQHNEDVKRQRASYKNAQLIALTLLANKSIFTPHDAACCWYGRYNSNDAVSVCLRDCYEGLNPAYPDEHMEMDGEEMDHLQESYSRIRTTIEQFGIGGEGHIHRKGLQKIANILEEEPLFLRKPEQVKDSDSELHHLAKSSVYTIIAGLLHKLSLEPGDKETAGKISMSVDNCGLTIQEKTIRHHMTEVEKHIKARVKE